MANALFQHPVPASAPPPMRIYTVEYWRGPVRHRDAVMAASEADACRAASARFGGTGHCVVGNYPRKGGKRRQGVRHG